MQPIFVEFLSLLFVQQSLWALLDMIIQTMKIHHNELIVSVFLLQSTIKNTHYILSLSYLAMNVQAQKHKTEKDKLRT